MITLSVRELQLSFALWAEIENGAYTLVTLNAFQGLGLPPKSGGTFLATLSRTSSTVFQILADYSIPGRNEASCDWIKRSRAFARSITFLVPSVFRF